MTREETIKWLESLKAEIGKSEHRTLWHYAEAIDLAIEALSEPSCDNCKENGSYKCTKCDGEMYYKCDDLISRADAIEAVKHSTAYMHDDLYEAISIRIPSAETTGALDDAIAKYVADGLMLPPNGNLIRREDALQCRPEMLNPNPNDKPNNYPIGWNDAIKSWFKDIKALPSADRPTVYGAPTTKDTLISREEVCEAIERYERHFNTKLETLKDLVAELPNHFTEYDTFCGVDMAEAIEVMTRYNADKPTRGRKDATEEDYHYCDDCEAVEMCMWYPYRECQFKVSRPTGEWIHDGVDVEGGVDWMHCSNCGKRDVWADATRTNYCPNCGARMKAR